MQDVKTALISSASDLLMLVLTVLLPVLTAYITAKLRAYVNTKSEKVKSDYARALIRDATNTLEGVVNATTQTYVDALKADGKFDEEAQKAALKKSMSTAKALINKETTAAIIKVHGDLDAWIRTQIESIIHETKTAALT